MEPYIGALGFSKLKSRSTFADISEHKERERSLLRSPFIIKVPPQWVVITTVEMFQLVIIGLI